MRAIALKFFNTRLTHARRPRRASKPPSKAKPGACRTTANEGQSLGFAQAFVAEPWIRAKRAQGNIARVHHEIHLMHMNGIAAVFAKQHAREFFLLG